MHYSRKLKPPSVRGLPGMGHRVGKVRAGHRNNARKRGR